MPCEQNQPVQRDALSKAAHHKLMVSGYICPDNGCALSSEIQRGMPIFSAGGHSVGKVAAVLLNSLDYTATHILLSRLPEVQGYWLLPVSWIAQVRAEEVHLCVPESEVQSLPQWHAE
jgi:hypothetical protein